MRKKRIICLSLIIAVIFCFNSLMVYAQDMNLVEPIIIESEELADFVVILESEELLIPFVELEEPPIPFVELEELPIPIVELADFIIVESEELVMPIGVEVDEFGLMVMVDDPIKCPRCWADVSVSCGSFIKTEQTGVCTNIVSNCQVWTRTHKTIFQTCGCGQGFVDGSHAHEVVHTACGRGIIKVCPY